MENEQADIGAQDTQVFMPETNEQETQEVQQDVQETKQEVEQTYEPQVHDVNVSKMRQEMEEYLDKNFPIKGEIDITKIDREDPQALAEFFKQIQTNSRDDIRNERAREEAKANFEDMVFEEVYKTYPKLKASRADDTMARIMFKGVSRQDTSPIKVVQALANYKQAIYNQAFQAGVNSVKTAPTPPAGQQGKPTRPGINQKAIDKLSSGSIDDLASLINQVSGKGFGGL